MSRIKKKKAILPVLLNGVTLIQPNRVTNTNWNGFSLMMHKIFTAIQLELQDATQFSMDNNQLNLFSLFSDDSSDVVLKVAYSSVLSDPTQYRDVRTALVDMSRVAAEIPYIDNKGERRLRITGLLKADIPEKPNGDSTFIVKIDKRMAILLVEIDKKEDGQGINWTKFSYDVAQSATCAHTPPIYKLLCSWRGKEFMKIRYKELREILGIPESLYERYTNFVYRVLEPVHKDLLAVGDVWFEFKHKGFKTKVKGEIWLHFKILNKGLQKIIDTKTENIRFTLTNFGLNSAQNSALDNILNNQSISRESIYTKIMEVEDFIYKNNSDKAKKPIENKAGYMVSALKKAFIN